MAALVWFTKSSLVKLHPFCFVTLPRISLMRPISIVNHPRQCLKLSKRRVKAYVRRVYAMRDLSFCIDRGGTFTDVFAAVTPSRTSPTLTLSIRSPTNNTEPDTG